MAEVEDLKRQIWIMSEWIKTKMIKAITFRHVAFCGEPFPTFSASLGTPYSKADLYQLYREMEGKTEVELLPIYEKWIGKSLPKTLYFIPDKFIEREEVLELGNEDNTEREGS